VKEYEIGWACSMHGDKRNAYRVLVGRPEGNRPLGTHVDEDNIKVDGVVWT
jgi:hypothetical protein